ncbi:tetratricopeptide repeat protein [Leptolyngbya sp. FACHB-711]|uniref:tetratricopeptide repeat protein n=1 Tax=Leptolyngbya sp. FACHB-711 TaxID=2692813 RepID=UPI001F5560E9|nr:tetratricopeptide repeat protein [Leptolyngbya sp. FACHB-711]
MTASWLKHLQELLGVVWQWFASIEPNLSGILAALGVLAILFGPLRPVFGFLKKRLARRKSHQPVELPDTFPFEIIAPRSPGIVRQLIGSNNDDPDDPLADFNIHYQKRDADRNVQKELEQLLKERRSVLILGKSGIGKSREAAELAASFNQDGWTILKLKSWEWQAIRKPSQLPLERIGTDRQILFWFDDLNRPLDQEAAWRKDKSGNALQLGLSPLPERLLELLEAYDRGCRPEEIRVIATARNETIPEREGEPSELEKLGLDQYPKLWRDRFAQYSLPEPDVIALVELLQNTVDPQTVEADPQDYQKLAEKSDRTFRVMVLNLKDARRSGEPLTQVFTPTLKGSWEKRYREAEKLAYAPHIYAAIGLLRQVNVVLTEFTVAPTAVLIANRWNQPRQFTWWHRWQINRTLCYLIAAQDILNPSEGQIEAANKRVEVGEYVPALSRLLQELADQHPIEMLSSLFGFGFAMSELKRYPQALEAFSKLLSILQRLIPAITDPEVLARSNFGLAFVWFEKGIALAELGQHQQAIDSWDEALKSKPDYHEAWYNRGIALVNLGRYEEAIDSWDEALKSKPDYHEAWNNRGNVLVNLRRYEEAIGSYDEALKSKRDYHEAWNNRGVALVNLRRYEEAIDSWDKALNIKPDDHAVWSNRGLVLVNLGRYEEAIDSWDKTLEYKPDADEAWYNKAYCYSLWNHVDEAIESLQRAIELNPGYREKAKTDSDLDNIRSDDRFKALIEEDSDSA